jgi:acyl carrier protein
METQKILTDYIKQDLLKGRKVNLTPEEDLLGAGIIDSLGILQLVAFIDESFGYQVPDEDVVYENFYSIQALANYLDSHK